MKKAPFEKKTPSQYRKPEFYWRGGDGVREQERIIEDYSRLLLIKRKSSEELKNLQNEVNESQTMLKERESYTTALADFLENDTNASNKESELKKEIKETEKRISELENELEGYTKYLAPNVLGSLQKENAYFLLEIQRMNKSYQNTLSRSDNYRNKLAEIVSSTRYRKAKDLEFKLKLKQTKKNELRKKVSNAKMENDSRSPPKTLIQTADGKEERKVLSKGISASLFVEQTEAKLESHPKKYNSQIEYRLQLIEELNDRMSDVGFEDGIVNVEELRAKYIEKEPNNEEEEEEINETNEEKPAEDKKETEEHENKDKPANDEKEESKEEEEMNKDEEKETKHEEEEEKQEKE